MVLIGSGPSLNLIAPVRLARFDSIAFNRSFLAWKSWGFSPTYHACLDPLSMAIIGAELPAVVRSHPSVHFFFHRDAARFGINEGPRTVLATLCAGNQFSTMDTRLTDLGNVGAISLQLLAIRGYRKVLLVGVDGVYASDGGDGRDPNHFRDDYAAGRSPLSAADKERYISGWPIAARECRRLGIEVFNASPGTSLTCFETIDFDRGLNWLTVH